MNIDSDIAAGLKICGHRVNLRLNVSTLEGFVYLGFYVTFNTVQVI